jgi:single-stranded DNA-binding protein
MSHRVVIPAEIISGDDITAQAIAWHRAKGGHVIIDGRLYLEPAEASGRKRLRLRVVAEQVVRIESHQLAANSGLDGE